MGEKKKRSRRQLRSFLLAAALLAVCFAATILILRLELEKRNEQAALASLPALARQDSAALSSHIDGLVSHLHTAAQLLALQEDSAGAERALSSLTRSVSFVQTGIRLSDGTVLLDDGQRIQDAARRAAEAGSSPSGGYLLEQAEPIQRENTRLWVVRLFVPIPGSDAMLFGAVDLTGLFSKALPQTGDYKILVFETSGGRILMDGLHTPPALGRPLEQVLQLEPEQTEGLYREIQTARPDGTGQLYLCTQPAGIPGWSLCVAVEDEAVGKAASIPSAFTYGVLIALYGVAMVAVLLYQSVRERTVREKLDREVERSNSVMNAALPAAEVKVFELLPSGMLRLFSPRSGQGRELKSTMATPGELLSGLGCSDQGTQDFSAALEKAAAGEESQVELRTQDQQETWLQLRMEPLPDNEEVQAIGTVRDVTQEVAQRQRQEAVGKLLDRMMGGTLAGIEVHLETDRWRLLWCHTSLAGLEQIGGEQPYSATLLNRFVPAIHPRDRDNFRKLMERRTLLSAYFSGANRLSLDYRIKLEGRYAWHSTEVFFFRDPITRQAMCNLFIRQVDRSKQRELEEKRRLEEKEQALFLQAKQLIESEDQLDFVHVISDNYQGIYAVNLNDDQVRGIKLPRYFARLLERSDNSLTGTLEAYCRELMDPEYIPAFRAVTAFDAIRAALDQRRPVELTYRKRDGTWLAVRVFPMPEYSPQNPETLWVFEDETATVNLRKQEEQAQVAARAAEAANEAKSQFLANMSHDIRTPLNAILGMSELGLREDRLVEKDNCFRDIRSSGRILLENINSILDLSKIEAGKVDIHSQDYRILSTLHDTITVLRMRAQEKKLRFTAQVDENIPSVLHGDDVSICHIIMNLGGNAIKYTSHGSVTMTVTWEPRGEMDGCLIVHMKDTGTGIRQEDLPFAFRSYSRLPQEGNRRIEGTGLGLSICQRLTELMNGQLGVESTYNEGSDFWVRLPQRVVDPNPCGAYRGHGDQEEEDLFRNSFTASGAVVLVVDDQPVNRRVIQGLLRPYQVEIHAASSGQEALEKLTQVWPDLILMDHMMPDMDGMEVTRRIREMGQRDPYFAVVPILALTANAMKGARENFLANGFQDFISKPVELAVLDEALRAWLPQDKQVPVRRDAAGPAVSPSQTLPPELLHIPGLDTERGLAFCGRASDYQRTLQLFREQVPQREALIREAWEQEKLDDYITQVHGLKSASRWIGADGLGEQAEALEFAAKDGDLDQLRTGTPPLLLAYHQLGEALGKALEEH